MNMRPKTFQLVIEYIIVVVYNNFIETVFLPGSDPRHGLTFELVDKIVKFDRFKWTKCKLLRNVVLTFESLDVILKFDHSNQSCCTM